MAHRKTQQEAEAVKASFKSNHPDAKIVIKDHPRGGYLIVESRICEECGKEFTTTAIGEVEVGGDYCRECKAKVYEQARRERESAANVRNVKQQAYYNAEAWYYAEEK